MAINTEIKDLMEKEGVLFEVAEKVNYKRELNAEEKEIAEISDAWCREIGKTGKDPECSIAEFINRTVNEELYNAPDELLIRFLIEIPLGSLMMLNLIKIRRIHWLLMRRQRVVM